MLRKIHRWPAVLLITALVTGCVVDDEPDTANVTVDGTAAAAAGSQTLDAPATLAPPPPTPEPELELEVDLSDRELRVYRGGELEATHPVAVGSEEWPTPTGEWTIGQVVWNPRWIPPEEEWAEEEEVAEPGDPENPLGRAQLVYSPPNTIHGTNAPESVGQAVSHGSIRVTNEVAMELAREVMEAGGAGRDESWYQAVRDDPTRRESVAIPNAIPIRVVS